MLAGFGIIAVLLAANALVFYLLARMVLAGMSHLPMIGRKYRHNEWDRLNRP